MQSNEFRRHQLVYVDPALCGTLDRPLGEWFAAGLPGIVRRPCFSENGSLCLGVPLPPSQGKLRLACEVPMGAIRKTLPPPAMEACAAAFPDDKRDALNTLVDELRRHDIVAHVVGSLAWEVLTGLQYMTENSDVDLLFITAERDEFLLIDAISEKWLKRYEIYCDIEIMLPNGNGFLWKEYRQSPQNVMVKGNSKVFMASPEQLGL